MSLEPPLNKARKLQEALQAKAKGSPGYRFYCLYDKVYRRDVLTEAYQCSLANEGAPGVDGQTFADIEKYGVERWLDELVEELRQRTYRAQAVRRGLVLQAEGAERPLRLPTGQNRVVQTAEMSGFGPHPQGEPH